MQNNIYNFAIRSNEINVLALCEMCDQMDGDMRDRFVNAILGIVDFEKIVNELPKVSKVYSHDNCRLRSVNYLKGKVDYEYDNTVVRYYRTEEEAKRLTEEGRGRWDGNNKRDDEHPFEGSHTFLETGTCDLYEWSK